MSATDIATPHINPQGAPIAETILLPGDPLRAKFIAENFLEDTVQFNGVRNMLGFTGTFNGKPISVMGSGMGIPSIGIYSWELIHNYGVKSSSASVLLAPCRKTLSCTMSSSPRPPPPIPTS